MYKKTITYLDYSDKPEEITEDFYFDLTMIELAENGWVDNSLQVELNRCLDSNSLGDLIKLFKKLIVASYGKRSADRKSFYKDDKITNDFIHSNAYTRMMEEMLSDDGTKMQKFIVGILPRTVNGQNIDYDKYMKEARKQAVEKFGLEQKEEQTEIEVVENADDNSSSN